jgi:hypothetical protein
VSQSQLSAFSFSARNQFNTPSTKCLLAANKKNRSRGYGFLRPKIKTSSAAVLIFNYQSRRFLSKVKD